MEEPRPNLFDLADMLSGPPPASGTQKWILGVVVPTMLVGYGSYACLWKHAKTFNLKFRGLPPLGGGGVFLDIFDGAAISLGFTLIFIGLFFHFHGFWSNVESLSPYYELGKLIALAGIVISAGIHIYFMLF